MQRISEISRLDVLVTHCLLVRAFLCSLPLLLIGLSTLVTDTVHEDFIAVDTFASLDPAFPVAILASLFAATFALHKLGWNERKSASSYCSIIFLICPNDISNV